MLISTAGSNAHGICSRGRWSSVAATTGTHANANDPQLAMQGLKQLFEPTCHRRRAACGMIWQEKFKALLELIRIAHVHRQIRYFMSKRRITDMVAVSEDSRFLLTFLESVAGDHTTYLVFSPHARHDFELLLSDPRTHSRKLHGQLFRQALRGVRALHTAGLMHRDLKPANIGISCLDPPHTVVWFMGVTIEAHKPSDFKSPPGTIGAVTYIAPEMEDVRFDKYGIVDIWTMARVGMQVLLPRKSGASVLWNRAYYFPSMDGKGRIGHFQSLEDIRDLHPTLPDRGGIRQHSLKQKCTATQN